jgi:hypothetical protein
MKNKLKLFTITVLCFFNLLISAQETINKSSIEVHEMNGFRFELHHQSKACQVYDGCISNVTTYVYNKKGEFVRKEVSQTEPCSVVIIDGKKRSAKRAVNLEGQ